MTLLQYSFVLALASALTPPKICEPERIQICVNSLKPKFDACKGDVRCECDIVITEAASCYSACPQDDITTFIRTFKDSQCATYDPHVYRRDNGLNNNENFGQLLYHNKAQNDKRMFGFPPSQKGTPRQDLKQDHNYAVAGEIGLQNMKANEFKNQNKPGWIHTVNPPKFSLADNNNHENHPYHDMLPGTRLLMPASAIRSAFLVDPSPDTRLTHVYNNPLIGKSEPTKTFDIAFLSNSNTSIVKLLIL